MDGEKRKRKVGYRARTNKYDDLSIKIKDVNLAKQIKAHCKQVNIGASDFVSECVKKYIDDVYSQHLQSLSKEDLIKMLLQKGR